MMNLQELENLKIPAKSNLSMRDLVELLRQPEMTDSVYLAYKYGFMRGQNNIKNQRIRKAPAGAANTNQGSPKPHNNDEVTKGASLL